MSKLCFGSFARLLKDATAYSNEYLIETLFRPFIGNNFNIDPGDQSRFINSKKNLPKYIKENNVPSLDEYFQETIVPHINQLKIPKLLSLLVGVIHGDDSIPDIEKSAMISQADEQHLSKFLSHVYLYALQQPNDIEESALPEPSDHQAYSIFKGKIYINGKELILPDKLIPPNDIDSSEHVYITELLKAYADAENLPQINADSVPPKYLRNFNEQRQNFYNAEAINRKVRDTGIYNQFEIFIQDTYDSIIDVHDQAHPNGYERLLKVLQQAGNRPQGKSLLETLPNWIGSSEKKGACHILVNHKKITWVATNE